MQKKSTTIIAMVILAAIFVGLAGFFYFKSQPAGPPKQTASPEDIALLKSIIEKEGITSLDMIDQAVADKKISEETGLVYKTFAIFGDAENLPGEFASDKVFFTANYELQNIREKFETLSPDAQSKIAPFLKRPDDPESYWSIKYGQEIPEAETVGGIIPVAHALRASPYTEFFVSADGKIKIWYPKVDTNTQAVFGTGNIQINAASAKIMAQKIKGYLDNDGIISDFTGLMRRQLMDDGTKGGDGKLDIYVAPAGTNLGVCYAEHGLPAPSHILINTSIGNNNTVLKTVLAHELFHSFQYLYKHDWRRDNWYGEATAVWSEDFIYPDANTEQEWLGTFLPYPEVTVYKETPPDNHHYAAYLFPFYLTGKFEDDLMRKSWEACEQGPCIDGIDKLIDGGLKKEWKEFTLWNYNQDPAQFYTNFGPFPSISSESGEKTETVFMAGDTPIDIDALKPLSADLSVVSNEIQDEKIKKITFKDLKNFTGKSEKASMKAVIYYKNGKREIEDWTDKNERSFCLENPDEDPDKVVLIFGNADIKKDISATQIKTVGKPSCYHIDQTDNRTSVIHFPYMESGMYKISNVNNTIQTKSLGEPETKAKEDQPYAYLTDWKLYYEFEQIRDSFSFDCEGSTAVFDAGWTTRSAGYLLFTLDQNKLNDDGTFSIDMTYGEPHPNGNYEDVPNLSVNCANLFFTASKIDLSTIKGTYKDIYRGKILEMNEDGALLEITNSCLYHSCTMQDGRPFQDINEPIYLRIKKSQN